MVRIISLAFLTLLFFAQHVGAQTITAPSSVTTDEDTNFAFTGGNAISVSGSGTYSATLQASSGHTITFDGTTAASHTTGDLSLTDLNTKLAGVVFSPAADTFGSTIMDIYLYQGGSLVAQKVVSVTIAAINDDPVWTGPTSRTTDEDTSITFSGTEISLSDVDSQSSLLTVTVEVDYGVVTWALTSGHYATNGTSGSGSYKFSASANDIRLTLVDLVYTPALNFYGQDHIRFTVNDNGFTGGGSHASGYDVSYNISITVLPINDDPVISGPSTILATEDFSLIIPDLSVADVDAHDSTSSGFLTFTLSVPEGQITLGNTSYLEFYAGYGDGTATVKFNSSLWRANDALMNITYTPQADSNGDIILTLAVNDNGNVGAGGGGDVSHTVTMQFASINDAPAITLPVEIAIDEDSSLTLDSSTISVTDVDLGATMMTVNVTVNVGTFKLNSVVGHTSVLGADNSAFYSFTATLANVQSALQGMIYTPPGNFYGNVSFLLSVSDNGGTGFGGELIGQKTLIIIVNSINDAPVIVVPGSQIVVEDTNITFSAATSTLISVSDVDLNEGWLTMTVATSAGILNLLQMNTSKLWSVTQTQETVGFTGRIDAVNEALSEVQVILPLDGTSTYQLEVTAKDNGFSGSGGNIIITSTVDIATTAVNDPPIISYPPRVNVSEDTELTISGLTVADVDFGASSTLRMVVQMYVDHGTFTMTGEVAQHMNVQGSLPGSWYRFDATLSQINQGFATLVYTPVADWVGTATLHVNISDQGNSGLGSTLTDAVDILVDVIAVNDAPSITAPGTASSIAEDTTVCLTSAGQRFEVSDVDVADGNMTLAIWGADGSTIQLNIQEDMILSQPYPNLNNASAIGFDATLSTINTLLASLCFTPPINQATGQTLYVNVSDNGNTGGGALTAQAIHTIAVAGVNDAASVLIDTSTKSVYEDDTYYFNYTGTNILQISDTDDNGLPMTVTLTVTSGAIHLGTTAGLSFLTGSSGQAAIKIQGTKGDLNTALATAYFRPAANSVVDVVFNVTVNDLGNTGAGTGTDVMQSVTFSIIPVNDAPLMVIPQFLEVLKSSQIAFTPGTATEISVSDVDFPDGSSNMTVSVRVPHGYLDFTASSVGHFNVSGGNFSTYYEFTGTATTINAALANLVYIPRDAYLNIQNETVYLNMTIKLRDLHNIGIGAERFVSYSIIIAIQESNNDPVITTPGTINMQEDGVVIFTGDTGSYPFAVTDSDSGNLDIEFEVTVTGGGNLTLNWPSFTITHGADGTDAMMLIASQHLINQALKGAAYYPPPETYGTFTMNLRVTDLGNTGVGGGGNITTSFNIIVASVNDPPTIEVPSAQSVNEDALLVFSINNGNNITVDDVDVLDNNGYLNLTINVSSGNLTVTPVTGLIVNGNWQGLHGQVVNLLGTPSVLNQALDGLIFMPTLNDDTYTYMTITVSDDGQSPYDNPYVGCCVSQSEVFIQINPVNDAPTVIAPSFMNPIESLPHYFSVVVGDVDHVTNGGYLEVTFVVDGAAILELNTTTNVSVIRGTYPSANFTVTGTVESLNTAFTWMIFKPDSLVSGEMYINITVRDYGQTGSGAAMEAFTFTYVRVEPANNPPVIVMPWLAVIDEDTDFQFNMSIEDPDFVGAQLTVGALQVVISLTGVGGLDIKGHSALTGTSPEGYNTLYNFTGKLEDINSALSNCTFRPLLDSFANVTISVVVSDLGNFGAGGVLTASQDLLISIKPLNDDPQIHYTQPIIQDQGKPLYFRGWVNLTDVDVNMQTMTMNLTVTDGSLNFANDYSAVGATYANASHYSLTGPIDTLNALLMDMYWEAAAEFEGTVTLTLSVKDNGHYGAGGGGWITAPIVFQISGINDAPVITAYPSASYAFDEDTTWTFSQASGNYLTISDVDVGSAVMEVDIRVSPEVAYLKINNVGPTVTTTDATSGIFTFNFQANITDVNALLEGMQLIPFANWHTRITGYTQPSVTNLVVTVNANDLGNSGLGGQKTAGRPLYFTINPINDAPVLVHPPNQVIYEDHPLEFWSSTALAISVDDPDATYVPEMLLGFTISVNHGYLHFRDFNATGTPANCYNVTACTWFDTKADINTKLNGLRFQPEEHYTGLTQVALTVWDEGRVSLNEGIAHSIVVSSSFTISVIPLNDLPSINLLPETTVDEDTILYFNSTAYMPFSIYDPDAVGYNLTVNITVDEGYFNLSSISNFLVTEGSYYGGMFFKFTAKPDDINNALAYLTWTPPLHFNGDAHLSIIVEDNGNAGWGKWGYSTKVMVIHVTAVNDDPLLTMPSFSNMPEGSTYHFNTSGASQLSVLDVDVGAQLLTCIVGAYCSCPSAGKFTVSAAGGALVYPSGDVPVVVVEANLSAMNAALGGAVYTAPLEPYYPTPITLTLNCTDNGNTGRDGGVYIVAQRQFTVLPINEPPVIHVPKDLVVVEGTVHQFGTALYLSDVDVNGGIMSIMVVVSDGTLQMTTPGVTVTGGANGSATIAFNATMLEANSILAGLNFRAMLEPINDTNVSFTVFAQDNHYSGSGGMEAVTTSMTITVLAINDDPVVSHPVSPVQTYEANTLIFEAGSGTELSVLDVDVYYGLMNITVWVEDGTITLSPTATGITITEGSSGSAYVSFTGQLTMVNSALNNSYWTPPYNKNGTSVFHISVSDFGNFGAGGGTPVEKFFIINVAEINNPPIITAPTVVNMIEDTVLTMSGSDLISVSDPDAGTNPIIFTLSNTGGKHFLTQTTGLTFLAGADGTASMQLQGSITDINAALAAHIFVPDPNDGGIAYTLALTVDDQGFTGPGGAKTETKIVIFNVAAVNDDPIITRPPDQRIYEDTNLTFNAGTPLEISISDVDDLGGQMRLSISVPAGTLTLSQPAVGLLGFESGADSTSSWTVLCNKTGLNAALSGLVFMPPSNAVDDYLITITINDRGHTGSGGGGDVTSSFFVNVTAVNDDPVITVPALPTQVGEDSCIGIASVSVDDVDILSFNFMTAEVLIMEGNITLNASGVAMLSTYKSPHPQYAYMVGTISSINSALAGMTYCALPQFSGLVPLTLNVTDNGYVGVGGGGWISASMQFAVGSINDPPVLTLLPTATSVNEDTTLYFSSLTSISIFDQDSDPYNLTLVLSADNGMLQFTSSGSLAREITHTANQTVLNDMLQTVALQPDANFDGTITVIIYISDNGHTGSGSVEAVSATLTVTVNAVNDLPVWTTPDNRNIAEDLPGGVNFTDSPHLLQITDVDAYLCNLDVSLETQGSGGGGVFWLGDKSNITIMAGVDQSAYVKFTGKLWDLNSVLQNMIYYPPLHGVGTNLIIATVNDNGCTGIGTQTNVNTTFTVTTYAINDSPVITHPSTVTTDEDIPVYILGTTVTDPDAHGLKMTVTVTVSSGTFNLAPKASNQEALQDISGADGSSSYSFRAVQGTINTVLSAVQYTPVLNGYGTYTMTITVNDEGNVGVSPIAGTCCETTSSIILVVNSINDPPVWTVPAVPMVTDEDVSIQFVEGTISGLSIYDVDSDDTFGSLELTIHVTEGTFALSTLFELTLLSGSQSSAYLKVFGNQTAINRALNNSVFTPPLNGEFSYYLNLTVNDLGNSGAGNYSNGLDVLAYVNVTVDPVNDDPVLTIPGSQVRFEDNELLFNSSADSLLLLNVADVDVRLGLMTVNLTASPVANLTLRCGLDALTFLGGTSNTDTWIQFKGQIDAVNTGLGCLMLTAPQHSTGKYTLLVQVTDNGNTGKYNGGWIMGSTEVTFLPFNDHPNVVVPANQSMLEDTVLTMSALGSNPILITDVDTLQGAVQLSIRLEVSNGTLILPFNETANSTYYPNGSTLMVYKNVSEVNSFLDGLQFVPPQDYTGPIILTVEVMDNGNIGAPNPLTTVKYGMINVIGINDDPVIHAPSSIGMAEDTTYTFTTDELFITDVDAGSGTMTMKFMLEGDGSLAPAGGVGLTGIGSIGGYPVYEFSASLAIINTAINGLAYTPPTNFWGNTFLQINVTDNGNTGVGGGGWISKTISITTTGVNDLPTIDLQTVKYISEDTQLFFSDTQSSLSNYAYLKVDDIDSGDGNLTTTLSVDGGLLGGFYFTVGLVSSTTFSMPLAETQQILRSFHYVPPNQFVGYRTLTIKVDDNGNKPVGTNFFSTEVTKSMVITTTQVNDAPNVTMPDALSIWEDTPYTFRNPWLMITDIDVGEGLLDVKLMASAGLLQLGSLVGFTFENGTADNSSYIHIRGQLVYINQALDGLMYTPPLHAWGIFTFTTIANDNGYTGGGGARETTAATTISVTAVNDAPVIVAPALMIGEEDKNFTFTLNDALNISDVDALEVPYGNLTLRLTSSVNGTFYFPEYPMYSMEYNETALLVASDQYTWDRERLFTEITPTQLQLLMDGLKYLTPLDYNGHGWIYIYVSDNGNTGAEGVKTATHLINLTSLAVNDDPVLVLPSMLYMNEEGQISVGMVHLYDVDAQDSLLRVTVEAWHGYIWLPAVPFASIISQTANNTRIIFRASQMDFNSWFTTAYFKSESHFNGIAYVILRVSDQGAMGLYGGGEVEGVLPIRVFPINDKPIVITPLQANMDEDSVLMFSTNGTANQSKYQVPNITIFDVDTNEGGKGNVTVALDATCGSFSYVTSKWTPPSGGLELCNSHLFKSSVEHANLAFEGLRYIPPQDFYGQVVISVSVVDNKNWGATVDDDIVIEYFPLYIAPVNDEPVITVPVLTGVNTTSFGIDVLEDSAVTFVQGTETGIYVTDVDAYNYNLTIIIQCADGVINLDNATNHFNVLGGNFTNMYQFTGSLSAINHVLDGMQFHPYRDFFGETYVNISVHDLGHTGQGGGNWVHNAARINVLPVNDDPIVVYPTLPTMIEDTSISFLNGTSTELKVVDVDSFDGIMSFEIWVNYGNFTIWNYASLVSKETYAPVNVTYYSFNATLENINMALQNLQYHPLDNFDKTAQMHISVTDNGHSGLGGPLSDIVLLSLPYIGYNDPPVVTFEPSTITRDEDSYINFTALGPNFIGITDSDLYGGNLSVRFEAAQGSWYPASVWGHYNVSGSVGSTLYQFSANLEDAQLAIDGLVYQLGADWPSNGNSDLQMTLHMSVADNGNSGLNGAQWVTSTITLTVRPINDAPVIHSSDTIYIEEDTTLDFTIPTGSQPLYVTDVDDFLGDMLLWLYVSQGSLSSTTLTGNAVVKDGGLGSGFVLLQGNKNQLNNVLAGMSFTPPTSFNGNITLHITVQDNGNRLAFPPGQNVLNATKEVQIFIQPLNDDPVLTLAASINGQEDQIITFTPGTASELSVSDADAADAALWFALSVSTGNMSINSSLVTSLESDGAYMRFYAPQAEANLAFATLVIAPPEHYKGAVTLIVNCTDLGNTGYGGGGIITKTSTISLVAVNDAPIITMEPRNTTVAEDTAIVWTGSYLLSLTDVDVSSSAMMVVLNCSFASVQLFTLSGLTTVAGADSSAYHSFTGTISDINTAFSGMSFTPESNYVGYSELMVMVSDQGNTGTGGELKDYATFRLLTTAMNDPPQIVKIPGPGTVSLAEDTAISFAAGTYELLVQDVDVDDDGGNLTLSLLVTRGTLSWAAGSLAQVSSFYQNGSTAVIFSAGQTGTTLALHGLTWTPPAHATGHMEFYINVTDNGYSGSGGVGYTEGSFAIDYYAINDDPVIKYPGTVTIDEDTPLEFLQSTATEISVHDVDLFGANLDVIIMAESGTFTISGDFSAATITAGAANNADYIRFLATDTTTNQLLASMVFTPTLNFFGNASLSVNISDQGVFGSGGGQFIHATTVIIVNSVNDAPLFVIPADVTLVEDASVVFTGNTGLYPFIMSDVDDFGGEMQLEVLCEAGTFTQVNMPEDLVYSGHSGHFTLTGNKTRINEWMQTATFTTGTDFVGTANITFTGNDKGNTGSGGPKEGITIWLVTTTAVNDAPYVKTPVKPYIDIEDMYKEGYRFNAPKYGEDHQLVIVDVDSANYIIDVTITLETYGLSGSFDIDNTVNTLFISLSLPVAQINAKLETLVFRTPWNTLGPQQFTVTVSDNGYFGTGGTKSATTSFNITVIPPYTESTSQTVTETLSQSDLGKGTATFTDTATVVPVTETPSLTHSFAPITLTFTNSDTPTHAHLTGTASLTESVSFTVPKTVSKAPTESLTKTTSATNMPTGSATFTGSQTLSPLDALTASHTGSLSTSPSAMESATPSTISQSDLDSATNTATATTTALAPPTLTFTRSAISSETITSKPTLSVSDLGTSTHTKTASTTVAGTITQDRSPTATLSQTVTDIPSLSVTNVPSSTLTHMLTGTDSMMPTLTHTISSVLTPTASDTPTLSLVRSPSLTRKVTSSLSEIFSASSSVSGSGTSSATHRFTDSYSPAVTDSLSSSPSLSTTAILTASLTAPATLSATFGQTGTPTFPATGSSTLTASTHTVSMLNVPTRSHTFTPKVSHTPSPDMTTTISDIPTITHHGSLTLSQNMSETMSVPRTPTSEGTSTLTGTDSGLPQPTSSLSSMPTMTSTETASHMPVTPTQTREPAPTQTKSFVPTLTLMSNLTESLDPTVTLTALPTVTKDLVPTLTQTGNLTETPILITETMMNATMSEDLTLTTSDFPTRTMLANITSTLILASMTINVTDTADIRPTLTLEEITKTLPPPTPTPTPTATPMSTQTPSPVKLWSSFPVNPLPFEAIRLTVLKRSGTIWRNGDKIGFVKSVVLSPLSSAGRRTLQQYPTTDTTCNASNIVSEKDVFIDGSGFNSVQNPTEVSFVGVTLGSGQYGLCYQTNGTWQSLDGGFFPLLVAGAYGYATDVAAPVERVKLTFFSFGKDMTNQDRYLLLADGKDCAVDYGSPAYGHFNPQTNTGDQQQFSMDPGPYAGTYILCYSYSKGAYQQIGGPVAIARDPDNVSGVGEGLPEDTRNVIIIVAIFVFVLLVIGVIFCVIWRRRKQEDETVRLEQARALKDNMDLIMPVADHPKVDNSVPNPLEAPERQTPVQNMALSAQPPASTEPQRPTGLKVVVLQGQDLQKTDDLSGVRPYVKLSFGGQLKQTTAESSAVWNEEFDFTIPQTGDYTLMDLKVEAYDEEPEKEQHDIIGSAVAAPFLLLSDATRADTWVQVFDSQDNANGRVHLQFEPIGVEPLAGEARTKTPPELPPAPGALDDENVMIWRNMAMQQQQQQQQQLMAPSVHPAPMAPGFGPAPPDYMPVLPLDPAAPQQYSEPPMGFGRGGPNRKSQWAKPSEHERMILETIRSHRRMHQPSGPYPPMAHPAPGPLGPSPLRLPPPGGIPPLAGMGMPPPGGFLGAGPGPLRGNWLDGPVMPPGPAMNPIDQLGQGPMAMPPRRRPFNGAGSVSRSRTSYTQDEARRYDSDGRSSRAPNDRHERRSRRSSRERDHESHRDRDSSRGGRDRRRNRSR